MVKQYPHILYATAVTDSVQDSEGNWIPGTSSTITKVCRAEPSSNLKSFVIGTDGQHLDYSWIVYMPLSTEIYQAGTKVEVKNNGATIVNDTIKQFHKGQLNMRLWL